MKPNQIHISASLLEYPNSTIDNLASPAQLLMSQRLQSVLPSVLPITLNQLTPEVIDPSHVSEQLERKTTTMQNVL